MTDTLFSGQSRHIATNFMPDEEFALLQADALEACTALPTDLFSLIITSPPYNIGKSYEKQTGLTQYLAWQGEVITELVRLLKPGGSICWQVGNYVESGEVFPLDMHFYPIFKNLGLQLRNRIVWHFEHGLHASLLRVS